jgi:biotin carboxyl carrier protein
MLTRPRTTSRLAAMAVALCLATAACGQMPQPDGGVGEGAAAATESTPPATIQIDRTAEPLWEHAPLPAPTDDPQPEPEPDPEPEPEPVVEVEAAPTAEATEASRAVTESGWSVFAMVSGVVLHHPAARVERVGFHEANHRGARQFEVQPDAIAPITLRTRGRHTGSRSAADIVVDPDGEIRSPVTGTVIRAGTYVLYCDYSDGFVVIDPDARPGWEVKLLHIDGVQVQPGERVEAGVTTLAPRPTPLPFESQVDKHTAEPSWPHVHVEVVDPSIPNPPSSGSGC